MIRTQIHLTDEQTRRLRRAARARRVSMAVVIREAVDRQLPDEDRARLERQRKAFELAGAFASGNADTADRHDDVLVWRRFSRS